MAAAFPNSEWPVLLCIRFLVQYTMSESIVLSTALLNLGLEARLTAGDSTHMHLEAYGIT